TLALRVWRDELSSPLGLALAHPLYILLARGWAALLARAGGALPLDDFAYRINLFSAVCAAATIGLVWQLVARLTGRRFGAAVAALVLAISHTFWTHAVLTEVYALYGLLLLVELLLLERYARTGRRGWLAAALLINGLNLSNHLLALLHLPGYAILIAWHIARRRLRASHVPALALLWICGAGLYFGMIAGRIGAGDAPTAVLREALTGSPYGEAIAGECFSAPAQAARTAAVFVMNFPTPVLLLAIPGCFVLAQAGGRRVVTVFLLSLLVVNTVFGFSYTVPDQYVFFVAAYVILAVLIGAGAGRWATTASRRRLCLALAILPALVYEVAPPLLQHYEVGLRSVRDLPNRSKYTYFFRPRKNGQNGAERFARQALETAGPDGLLMAGSTMKAPIVYAREVQGDQRDVVLTIGGDVEPLPPTVPVTPLTVRRFAQQGRAFITDVTPGYLSGWLIDQYDFEPAGPIYRLKPK
ncbi:MAG: DUF2723 domain-containing protein, partial [Phycisphaerae bacterium]